MKTIGVSFFKTAVKTAIGKPIICVAERYPETRSFFRNIARITEPRFGDAARSIPIFPGNCLKLTYLSSDYLSFQLFWRGLGHYEGFLQREELKRIPPAPFHFLNCLISERPPFEVDLIFRRIPRSVDQIDLYERCKDRPSLAAWALFPSEISDQGRTATALV